MKTHSPPGAGYDGLRTDEDEPLWSSHSNPSVPEGGVSLLYLELDVLLVFRRSFSAFWHGLLTRRRRRSISRQFI